VPIKGRPFLPEKVQQDLIQHHDHGNDGEKYWLSLLSPIVLVHLYVRIWDALWGIYSDVTLPYLTLPYVRIYLECSLANNEIWSKWTTFWHVLFIGPSRCRHILQGQCIQWLHSSSRAITLDYNTISCASNKRVTRSCFDLPRKWKPRSPPMRVCVYVCERICKMRMCACVHTYISEMCVYYSSAVLMNFYGLFRRPKRLRRQWSYLPLLCQALHLLSMLTPISYTHLTKSKCLLLVACGMLVAWNPTLVSCISAKVWVIVLCFTVYCLATDKQSCSLIIASPYPSIAQPAIRVATCISGVDRNIQTELVSSLWKAGLIVKSDSPLHAEECHIQVAQPHQVSSWFAIMHTHKLLW